MPTGKYCGDCPHAPQGERFIEADGSGDSSILFVGDSPWKEEMLRGRNFSGPAGHLYETWLSWIGTPRGAVTTANSMWCRPSSLGWTDNSARIPAAYAALHHCRPYLDELVERTRPRVIVPMGNVALGRVVGMSGIERNQGYIHESVWGIPAVPTFHPSYVMQGKQKLSPVVKSALLKAQRISRGELEHTKFILMCDPSIDELRGYMNKFPCDLGDVDTDIETPYSADIDEDDIDLDAEEGDDAEVKEPKQDSSWNIVRGGFALEPGVAVSFPFEPPYIELYFDVLRRARRVWEWTNRHFDSDRLRAAGATLPQIASGMWAWHFLQSDLPKALAFVAPLRYVGPPWKQEAQVKPAWYNAMDNAIQWLLREWITEQLKAEGRWHWFERHCVETDEILVRMCEPGLLVDRAVQAEFKERLEGEHRATLERLDTEVPVGVKKVKRWVRAPKDMTGVVCEPTGTFQKNGKEICNYSRMEPFNPGSPTQVAALIKALDLKMPFDRKRGKATTEAKHLKRFIGKSPVFRTLLDCREKGKMLSTYMWDLDSEGRIFTHYGFNPSTWRKNSYQVNTQNIPKRSDLAKQFRRMIVARPGHVLMTFDAAAIEAVLVGYFAGSDRYIRLSRVGVHDWVTAVKVGQPIPLDLPNDELMRRCKAIKKAYPVEREMIKRVVHLSNYKGTPGRIVEEYPEHFASERAAKELQELYLGTEAGKDVVAWQNRTLSAAHKEKMLQIPFGYRHYFYNVFSYDKTYSKWRLGDDAKRCIAFRPQATASAIQTEVLLWLNEHHEWVMPFLRLIIHDEIVLEMPEDLMERVAPIMMDGMTQPWPQLDGLWIGCEGKIGHNLADANPSNPLGLRGIEVGIKEAV